MCSFRQSNHPQKVAQRCFAPARQETEWYAECHSLLLHIKVETITIFVSDFSARAQPISYR